MGGPGRGKEREEINKLRELEKFKSNYCDVLRDFSGKNSLEYHSIPTGNTCPVRLPTYRLAQKAQDTLERKLDSFIGDISVSYFHTLHNILNCCL